MTRRGNNLLMMRQTGQGCHLPVVVIILGLILAVTLLMTRKIGENSVMEERIHDHESVEPVVQPNPTVEFINGTEVIWQVPTHPKAVLFIAHGCDCTPRYFWPSCPRCPKCVGLPEEIRIVDYALAQKYAVLIIKSTDACWAIEKDGLKVKQIISLWVDTNKLTNLPLVGLGASSGGYFLSVLATEVKFRGIVLMIAAGLFDEMGDIPAGYPPTLFVHMPKDVKRARKIDRFIKFLKRAGVEVKEITCMEFPLTPNWLAGRIPGFDQTTCSRLLKVFHDKGFIDGNGYMKTDGRVTPWREALKENNFELPFGSAFMHHLQEELNLAYAYHEMTSLQSGQIFEWLHLQIR